MSLDQATDVCTLDLKVPFPAVIHVCITDIYCFQYELFKKCQETSRTRTLFQTHSMSAAKSSAERNLLPPLSCSLTVIYHKVVGFSPLQHLINAQG